MKINYQSEPIADYNKALSEADTLEKLRGVLTAYDRVAHDAKALVDTWTAVDFKDWRRSLAQERRGKFMGDDAAHRFAVVLMPDVLFRVAIVSDQFKAPWGLCFIRMLDAGQLIERDGFAEVAP